MAGRWRVLVALVASVVVAAANAGGKDHPFIARDSPVLHQRDMDRNG